MLLSLHSINNQSKRLGHKIYQSFCWNNNHHANYSRNKEQGVFTDAARVYATKLLVWMTSHIFNINMVLAAF